MTLVEVAIAVFVLSIGLLALLSLQPSAWRTVGKADYLGRAAEILQKQLENEEAFIMNPCNTVTEGTSTATLLASGQEAAIQGDATYTVTTTITAVGANLWRVEVTVTWVNQLTHGYRSIRESILVTRQDAYRFPQTCS